MKLYTQEEWNATKSHFEMVVPEIRAYFFTGGRPTTHNPDGGLVNIDYANNKQWYLHNMTEPGAIEKIRHELQGYYIQLVSDKTVTHPNSIDNDYLESMIIY